MKKGMLITNGFVGEESFKSLFRALMEAAEKENIAIEQQSNDSLLFDIASGEPLFDIDRYSFGIFWDKDIMLGQMLEKMRPASFQQRQGCCPSATTRR